MRCKRGCGTILGGVAVGVHAEQNRRYDVSFAASPGARPLDRRPSPRAACPRPFHSGVRSNPPGLEANLPRCPDGTSQQGTNHREHDEEACPAYGPGLADALDASLLRP